MSKYGAHVTVTNDVVVVDEITLDTWEDLADLTAMIKRAFQQRGQSRLSDRRTKAQDPATYGLTVGGLVTVGNGMTVWTLCSIEYEASATHANLVRADAVGRNLYRRYEVDKLVRYVEE